MKKTSFFGKALFGAAVVTLSLGAVSCKDNNENDPKEVAEEENEAKFDENDAMEDDAEYLVAAASMDMKEIELGKLAQQKGTHADVKAFGKMMEDAHTKSLNDIKSTAEAKNISLPNSAPERVQDKYEDLNEESGTDFDKKYAEQMVKMHEKAADKMEEISEKANDADIRMWAANMLPEIRKHHEEAKALKDKVDAVK